MGLYPCSHKRGAASVVDLGAHVGVAIGGIVSQTSVQLKRLIRLHDAVAWAVDDGWAVRSDAQRRPQQGSLRKPYRVNRPNEVGATSRDVNAAFCLFIRMMPVRGPFRPLKALHDDRRSRLIPDHA